MQTLTQIRNMLEARGIRPKHRLGQNFLHDHNQLRRIVESAELQPGDLVLEVGPGTGVLTGELLDASVEVVACELDRDMAAIVVDRFGDRLRLHRGDCLDRHRHLTPELLEILGDREFHLVANLPYQSATPLIMDLLLRRPRCRGQVVLIQKEVADRLASPPGDRTYGVISVVASVFGRVRRIGDVPPGCFWPPPKVTSSIVRIGTRDPDFEGDRETFADFVAELFRTRRKQIGAILGRMDLQVPDEIDPTRRPESFSPEEFLDLFRRLGARFSAGRRPRHDPHQE